MNNIEETIRKIEKVVVLTIIIGIILKLLHIPFASPLLVISLGSLSVIYFIKGGDFLTDPKSETTNAILSRVTGIVLAIIPIGILFKIMYWPMAQVYLALGSILSLILFAFMYMKSKNAPEESKNYYTGMLLRIGVLAGLAFIFYLTPMATLIKLQHWDDPELARLKTESYEHPEDKEARRRLDEYWHQK